MESEPKKQPPEKKEPVPFTTCLLHEGKKSYWFVVKGLVFLTMMYVGWLAGNAALPVFSDVLTAILTFIWSLVTATPWYVLAALGLVTIPAAYTLAVCLIRRYKIVWPLSKGGTCLLAVISAYIALCFSITWAIYYG